MINPGISGVPIRIFVGRSEFGSALTMCDLKISEILLGDVVGWDIDINHLIGACDWMNRLDTVI